jgi:hypothetical protein
MPTRPVLESSRLDLSNCSRSQADKAYKTYIVDNQEGYTTKVYCSGERLRVTFVAKI